MNERFKELAKQVPNWNCNGVYLGPYEKSLEKFAELIVAECAGIYSRIDNGNLHMGTDDYLEALHKTFRS